MNEWIINESKILQKMLFESEKSTFLVINVEMGDKSASVVGLVLNHPTCMNYKNNC